MDFPYRKAGRRAPDRAPVLLEAVRAEVSQMDLQGRRLVMGGRSMGGRICSMAVAEGLPAAGLVLVSYPLHPPGKPAALRTDHFDRLEVPCLFVSGTRDAFGTPAEIETAVAAIPGPVTLRWIEGKDHSLRGCDATVTTMVIEWLSGLSDS
jgi:predicted alpha/beta-hydrolase family hydrolase